MQWNITPQVSVIIPHRRDWHYLGQCLQYLTENAKLPVEIIVSDNSEQPEQLARIQQEFPHVRTVEGTLQDGFGTAVNHAAAVAHSPLFLLLDADVIIKPGMIEQLVTFVEARPDVGGAAARLFTCDGQVQETVRAFPTWHNALFARRSLFRKFFPQNKISRNYLKADLLEGDEPGDIDWAAAAGLLLRCEAFVQVHGFDESYPFYWTDLDLCRRIREAGWRLCYVPTAVAVHDEQNDPRKPVSWRRIWLFHQGIYRYFCKYHAPQQFHPLRPIVFSMLTIRAALVAGAQHVKPWLTAWRTQC